MMPPYLIASCRRLEPGRTFGAVAGRYSVLGRRRWGEEGQRFRSPTLYLSNRSAAEEEWRSDRPNLCARVIRLSPPLRKVLLTAGKRSSGRCRQRSKASWVRESARWRIPYRYRWHVGGGPSDLPAMFHLVRHNASSPQPQSKGAVGCGSRGQPCDFPRFSEAATYAGQGARGRDGEPRAAPRALMSCNASTRRPTSPAADP
jgi:hypothetical protein